MPVFHIEQYELHSQTYSVEASDEADAIKKLLDGEAEPLHGMLEFIEVAEDRGLPVREHRELAYELGSRGVALAESVIPTIRSVVRVMGRVD